MKPKSNATPTSMPDCAAGVLGGHARLHDSKMATALGRSPDAAIGVAPTGQSDSGKTPPPPLETAAADPDVVVVRPHTRSKPGK